jgi:hypothetical protein
MRDAPGAGQPDVALHHHICGPANQNEMFHVIAANQNQTPVAVDRSGIHHCKPRLAVAPTGDEGSKTHAADHPDDDQHHKKQDQRGEGPENGGAVAGSASAIEKLRHRHPQEHCNGNRRTVERCPAPPQVAFACLHASGQAYKPSEPRKRTSF